MGYFFNTQPKLPMDKEYFVSLLSGIESGLATTAALVVGLISSGETNTNTLIVISIISFSVQAFNGAVGRFSSERINDEIENVDKIEGYRKPLIDASLQFIAHVIISVVILLPFYYIDRLYLAMALMIGAALGLMFFMGLLKGFILKTKLKKNGLEMIYLASLIIVVGAISGLVVR